MSYINEALKKAQKEKDAGYLKYGDLLAAGGDRRISHHRYLWWSLPVVLLVACALIMYFRLDSLHQPDSLHQQADVTPKPKTETPPPPPRVEKIDELKLLYERARLLHKKGRLEEARRLYQDTLRLDPGYVEALNNLGVIYIHEKDLPAARNCLEKAVKLDPGHADIYYNLACLHAIRGEAARSLAYLKKAANLNPEVRGWAQTDGDLINLRDLPQFKEIVKQSSNS